MTYEEKRELRLQISQLLADAGLNQKAIKDMVEKEIENKIQRAVDQCLESLNDKCDSGDYISERIIRLVNNIYISENAIERIVKEELKNKVIQVVSKDCENG